MVVLLVLVWLALGYIAAAAFWADIQRPEWRQWTSPADVVTGIVMVALGPVALIAAAFASNFFARGLKFIPHRSPPE